MTMPSPMASVNNGSPPFADVAAEPLPEGHDVAHPEVEDRILRVAQHLLEDIGHRPSAEVDEFFFGTIP